MISKLFNDLFGKTPPSVPKGKKSKRKSPKSVECTTWLINEHPLPIEIHREHRRSWRYAFGKTGIIVRIPKFEAAIEAQLLNDIRQSLTERTAKKPQLLTHFDAKNYQNGQILTVGERNYSLDITTEPRQTNSAKMLPNRVVQIKLSDALTEGGQQKVIATLLSRVVAQERLPEFSRRVQELNYQHFRKKIKNIHFKNNHSNWGSCSSSGNLNFSTRLLFAPDDVQDYVIIHELAHLVELNHSDRFWQLVRDAMPDFQEKEKWLTQNSRQCRW